MAVLLPTLRRSPPCHTTLSRCIPIATDFLHQPRSQRSYTILSRLQSLAPNRSCRYTFTPHNHGAVRARAQSRSYYTPNAPQPNPYPPAETAILSAALTHVPTYGFTLDSLAHGATSASYLPASLNLFPRGAFDLLLFYLVTQRLALKSLVQFPTPVSPDNSTPTAKPLPTGAKVRALILARLHANKPVIHHYSEAIALMSLAGNIPASTAELGRLADEIWYLAGDVSVDTSWYTKRGLVAGVYASAELFMTQDKSAGYKETEKFVDRRLDDVRRFGGAAGAVGEWVSFTAGSAVNVVRSLGVRI